ncbi:hypothetical protein JG688_00016874 [Phytophthora aleatoria]|uniref:Uncharacterized protein n=1 Tax=Phytophthora aleatoria TaxID=2496075 RepID=A0A8J5I7K7_9STRA|nr:hypothetical protein JG688_00016874 [Phytophthora aleatoria]
MSGAYAGAGAHVLDEFRYFLCDDATISGTSQFEVLHQHYADASVPTKGMLIEDFIMMDNINMNLEIQQHACGYLALRQLCQCFPNGEGVLRAVLEPMPLYQEKHEPGLNQQKAVPGGDGAENAAAQTYTIALNFVIGVVLMVISFVLDVIRGTTSDINSVLIFVWRLSPRFNLGNSLLHIVMLDTASIRFSKDEETSPFITVHMGFELTILLLTAIAYMTIAVRLDYSKTFAKVTDARTDKVLETTTSLTKMSKRKLFELRAVVPMVMRSSSSVCASLGWQQNKPQIIHEAMTTSISSDGISFSYRVKLSCQISSFKELVTVNEVAFLQRWNALKPGLRVGDTGSEQTGHDAGKRMAQY